MLSDIGQRIKQRRKQLGLSADALGKILHKDRATIYRYEKGEITKLPIDVLEPIADFLNVSPAYLMGWEDLSQEKLTPCDSVKIPVLGYVAAGTPIEAHEEVIEHIDISEDLAKRGSYFGLRIQGDSMEPRFYNGDVVVVREQKDVENGQIAIVIVNGDFGTCKKVLKKDNGLILQPLNQRHEPVFYSWEDVEKTPVTICGLVVGLRADIK